MTGGIRGISLGCVVLLMQFLYLPVVAGVDGPNRPIRVVLRFDDPSATTDMETEIKLIEALRRYRMVCTFGVVPFRYVDSATDPETRQELPLPAEKVELFATAAQQGVLEIALHGYSHQNNRPAMPRPSEFAGLEYDEQMRKIQRGKTFLEDELGIEVNIFVPPWSAYDLNTIKAADEIGFQYLSANMRGPGDSASPMAFLPMTCSLAQIREAIAAARTAPDQAPIVVGLFHEYDFFEVDALRGVMTFDQFLEILRWLSQQPDVRITSMGDISDADGHRYVLNQRLISTPRYLPYRLRGSTYPQVLLSAEGVQIARHRQRPVTRLLAFYSCLALVVGGTSFLAISMLLIRRTLLRLRFLLFSGPALVAGTLAWAFHDGHFGGRMRMTIVITGAVGYCLGAWGALLWQRYRVGMRDSRESTKLMR
jgi:peptidoglycan/xylan/chitin deacetylase (PgdA/CDA1 family)